LWYVLNTVDGDVVDSVMDEIDFGGDRAAAIVGAAFVEDHLTHYIRSKMVSDNALQNKLFAPGAVFGDFGTKINLGYLMGDAASDNQKVKLEFFDHDDLHKPVVQFVTAVRCLLALFTLHVRQVWKTAEPPF
jgi:hypothetical protein